MMIDVVIPCYLLPDKDGELIGFFLRTVQSLLLSTRQDLHLIVIDNGSPVGAEVLREYAGTYVRNRENKGYGPAVNQGLRLSTTQVVMVINNDLAFGHCDWPATAAATLSSIYPGIVSAHLIENDPSMQAFAGEYPGEHFNGSCWAVRRDVLDEVGLLDENFERGMFEDKDYVRRVLAAGWGHYKAGWVSHVGGATWGKLPDQHKVFLKNRAYYQEKWRS